MPANLLTNPNFTGAIVGPISGAGAPPTNWSTPSGSSFATTIVDFGLSPGGLQCVDFLFSTASAGGTGDGLVINFPRATATAAQHTASIYVALLSGSLPAGTLELTGNGYNSGVFTNTPIDTVISITSSLTRYTGTGTFSAGTNQADITLLLHYTAGVAFTCTLRVAAPRLETGAVATPAVACQFQPPYTMLAPLIAQ